MNKQKNYRKARMSPLVFYGKTFDDKKFEAADTRTGAL